MRKAWTYQRKNTKGWWVGWIESGKRKAKAFPNKTLAEHFRQLKYTQLNSDVFVSTINVDWQQMLEEYERSKRVAGFQDTSIYEAMLTLRHFERLIGPCSSKQITQALLDKFILKRSKEIKRSTLNKDINNLKAFLTWARRNKYLDPNSQLEVKKVKVEQPPANALDVQQVKALLQAVAQNCRPTWRIRILLAITTGLRRGDIEDLRIGDIHLDRNSINTKSKKTGKRLAERPIPAYMTTELANYIVSLPDGQEKLFADTHTHKKWKRIREKAGLPDLKFHDLRKTFASALAQRGISTAVTQRLLEHSSAELTNRIYTNVDPVLRKAIDRLPMEDWLKPE